MEKNIYYFLDKLVGNKVKCIPTNTKDFYNIYSLNGIHIVSFKVLNDGVQVSLVRPVYLSKLVSNFFGIGVGESSEYIRDWFGDRHKLNKVRDILKFIPEKSPTK